MPLLSIILPVHGVASYLHECIDSILEQSFSDFELIAIDDRSPDRCGEILDEYAQSDPRIKVIHLTENVGLGGARNVGMAEATGEYVWFVDSDDWLARGALGAVARRLKETSPDVLLVEFGYVGIERTVRRGTLHERVPAGQVPDVFNAKDFPGVLRVLHTAWNRVLRREWLVGLGISFQPGWYEDVSHTYTVVAAAERISTLYRICYHYREGRPGSITAASGDDRHFQVFDQYAITFRDFDRLGINDPTVRNAMATRMRAHCLAVLSNTGRIAPERRREFADRIASDYKRYRVSGAEAADAPKSGRSLRSNRLVRAVKPTVKRARRTLRKAKRYARGRARYAKRGALRVYYHIQRRLPLDDHLAVYSSYWGNSIRCNPAAIYEAARTIAPNVHGVFLIKKNAVDTVPPGADYAVVGSAKHLKVLARAKYLFNNVNFPPPYRKREGSVFVQTHHGTPLKAMGMDHYRWPVGGRGMDLKALLRRCQLWDYSLSTSAFNTEVWGRAYPAGYQSLEFGYPRNDVLDRATAEDVAAARAKLGLRDDEQVILYAPTHRDYQGDFDLPLDTDAFAEALGPNARVLLRAHHFDARDLSASGSSGLHPRVLDVSAWPVVEELYLASDMLITDYSSLVFDYAHLDRPIAIFAPDWETYKLTRGVTFDLFAKPPGVVATTFDELVDAFVTGEVSATAAAKARAEFRDQFCPHHDGTASERVVRYVLLGERETLIPRQAAGPRTAVDDHASRASQESDSPVHAESSLHLAEGVNAS